MDKDTDILTVELEDSFLLEADATLSIAGLIARFRLQNITGAEFTKHYFIPIVISTEPISGPDEADGVEARLLDETHCTVSLAEHSSVFQQVLIRAFQTQRMITTQGGNTVSFAMQGEQWAAVDTMNLAARPLNVSTSNVLTVLTTNRGDFISKAYKDMRGDAGVDTKQWPPNMEMPRYEALAVAGYTNMPRLHGVSYYLNNTTGARAPLLLLMDSIANVGDVGGIFLFGLTQLLDSGMTVAALKRALGLQVTCYVAKGLAATVSAFHYAFLQSGKPEFAAVPATESDIDGWGKTATHRFEQALLSLGSRAGERPEDAVLQDLVGRLKLLAPRFIGGTSENEFEIAPSHLFQRCGRLMKAQVHGDLSTAQGLIASLEETSPITLLLDRVARDNEREAFMAAEILLGQVRWIDFEGEPAKDPVAGDYDVRQNLLVDVASVVQGLWYIANIKLYSYLELSPHQQAAHQDPARKVSLVLAGQLGPEEAGIPRLSADLVQAINLWLSEVGNSFIEGYLDKVEALRMENAILSPWSREVARTLIDYWMLFRALHELRYETYGRDIGWEGIPAGRILQLISRVELANDGQP